ERPAGPSVAEYMPGTPAPQTISTTDPFGAAQHFIKGRDIPRQWWALFHSQPLNDLIEQSINANPNIASVQAALRQARENTLAQKGSYYPQVSVGFAASRNLTPLEALSPASGS